MFTGSISAIIPTFNRRDYVVRAVESILLQQPVPEEIIVVDDGSTDGTTDLLRTRFGDSIRVIEQANSGVSAARRRGVLEARGDWIAFLDSDDEWVSGRSRKMIDTLDSLQNTVDWIFGDTAIVHDSHHSESLYSTQGFSVDGDFIVLDSNTKTQFPLQYSLLQSSVIRKSTLISSGCFSENLSSSEDFLISFRASLTHTFAAIPDVVTKLYRTADLKDSSIDATESGSVDYYRSRALAFGEAVSILGATPWARLHQEAVRGWCLALGAKGRATGALSLEQFKYGVSSKSIVFLVLAMFGPRALTLWRRMRTFRT